MHSRTVLMGLLTLLVGLSLLVRVHAEEVAPDFTLIDVDGQEFSLADFRGTTVVLTFVATKIITCKMQVFVLNNISKYFGDDVIIVLIGINNETLWVGGDTEEQLRQFRDDCGFEGIVARDIEGVTDDYSIKYIPTTIIIDQAGYIRLDQAGYIRHKYFEELHVIVPEFSATAILLLIMITIALAGTMLLFRTSGKGRKFYKTSFFARAMGNAKGNRKLTFTIA